MSAGKRLLKGRGEPIVRLNSGQKSAADISDLKSEILKLNAWRREARAGISERGMEITQARLGKMHKAIVAYLDGRRLKGHILDFSATRGYFHMYPADDPVHAKASMIQVAELKAVFFVKDFAGNKEHADSRAGVPPKQGKRVEVTFSDGEIIVGSTEDFNRMKIGFFLSPVDPESNNIRIFAVNKNVRDVKML